MYCNNNKYIYNGWNNPITNKPCPLYKFNWNIHENKPFSLNTDNCKINFDLKQEEKYSFNKGSAVLIYVRKTVIKSSDTLISDIKSNSLSNMNNIINEYFDLNELNEDKLKLILKRLNVSFNDTDDYDILENKLFNKLEIFYNYKGLTRNKLIQEIKKIKPELTNLHLRKKIELENILKSIIDKTIGHKRTKDNSQSPIKKVLKVYDSK